MSDTKTLPELVSDMLIKQDKTNDLISEFLEISIKHFESQLAFNQKILDKLNEFEKIMKTFVDLEQRVKNLESLESRIRSLELALKAS